MKELAEAVSPLFLKRFNKHLYCVNWVVIAHWKRQRLLMIQLNSIYNLTQYIIYISTQFIKVTLFRWYSMHVFQMTLVIVVEAGWTLVTPSLPVLSWGKQQVQLFTSSRVSVGGETWPRPPESLTSMSHLLSMILCMWNFNGRHRVTTMTKAKVRIKLLFCTFVQL